MEKIKMGTSVKTLVDKVDTNIYKENIIIPKGTKGLVCEVRTYKNKEYALVEIWGEKAPEGVCGVFDYSFDELEIINNNDK